MGNLCSKRAAVSDDSVLLSDAASNSHRGVLQLISSGPAPPALHSTRDNQLLGTSAARSCARLVCGRLQSIFAPIINSLDQQLAANNAALTWPALQLVQLQAFICASLIAGDTSDTISHLLAVLYTLASAAPAAVAGTIMTYSPAINRLMGILSVILSNHDSTSAAQSWGQWQQLAAAVGFTSSYFPVVLTPASKALLLHLEAAANSASVRTLRLQVHRNSVFAGAYASLLSGDHSQLSVGPCVISPAFLASTPDSDSKPGIINSSMQLASKASSSQGIRHATSSTAGQICVDVQSSSAGGSAAAAQAQARHAAAESGAGRSDGGSALREEGEGRGPRREFFAAVGVDISAGSLTQALFVYNNSAACYWYNTRLPLTGRIQQQYQAAGWLAGQALHNRALLGIPVAPLVWQKVLAGKQFQATLQTLQDFDPDLAQTLSKVLQSGGDLAALLQLEGLSQNTSADAYMQGAVQRIVVEEVEWQSTSFAQGFCAAVSLDLLQRYLVTPRDLAEMVSGGSSSWRNVDAIQDIFHVVQDRQLQQEFAALSRCLWEVVNGWDVELKQQFVLFVTGSRRLPQPHTELLHIQLPFVAFDQKDHAHMLSRLPQAHTCENILELPNYQESLLAMHNTTDGLTKVTDELEPRLRHIIHDRLKLAVTCCNGYGLDQSLL